MEFALLQNDKLIDLSDLKNVECLSVNQSPPQMEYGNLEYETDDGERETNNTVYKPFEIEVRFLLRHNNKFDRELLVNEFYTTLYQRKSYFIMHELMPGKRYPVQVQTVEKEAEYLDGTILTVVFRAFKARSESIEKTINKQDIITQKWQHGQGMLATDYDYTFKKNNFSVYNLGDFDVDPRRKHELRIVLKGESDGAVTIYNKTTSERFIYNSSLDSKRGETLELDGITPYKNGVNCGIDTNGGLITLATGENKIQIQNTSNVEVFFDFRYLYKV